MTVAPDQRATQAKCKTPPAPFEVLPLSQFLKRPLSRRRNFNGWRFDRRTLCLVPDVAPWYEVGLERCRTSAQMLDWIMQIAGKAWATDRVLAGLVRAFDYYLDPQAHLCSGGVERGPLDVLALLGRKARR